jgi:hypothetical protein
MYTIYCALFIIEIMHAIMHYAVITKIFTIKKISLIYRRLYFSCDFITVIISFLILRGNLVLTAIHFIIHILAICHLFNIYETSFFKQVFELAEQKWNKHIIIKILYILGTYADILIHILNAYHFLLLIKN